MYDLADEGTIGVCGGMACDLVNVIFSQIITYHNKMKKKRCYQKFLTLKRIVV